MLNEAIRVHPKDFKNFDRTKNVQDQLQEMAHVCECSDPVCLLIDFHKFVDRESNPDIEHSWEQLWLAFTMHELHNKKWAGKKWEIVKEGV